MEEQNPNKPSANEKEVLSAEIESYSEICKTVSTSIRWLIFAIAVCSGVAYLCLANFYFGNLNFAIKRDKTNYEMKGCNPNDESNSECEKLSKKIEDYEELQEQTYVVQIPLVNLKLIITDFILVVISVGIFYWFWLWHTLKYTRNMLCSFYNNNKSHFSEPITHTVSSFFLILWSGGTRKTISNPTKYIFASFLLLILVIIFSDLTDSYNITGLQSSTLSDEPGWGNYRWYFYGSLVFEFSMLFTGIRLWLLTNKLIKDIRNLLLLIEWSDRSLYPMLRRLFEEIKYPLLENGNEVAYQEEDEKTEEFSLKFRINLKDDNLKDIIFSLPSHYLVRKVEEFSNRPSYERKARKWMLNKDEKKGILTTFEERRMKRFFYEMLANEEFGGNFSKQFYKQVIEELPKIKFLEKNERGIKQKINNKFRDEIRRNLKEEMKLRYLLQQLLDNDELPTRTIHQNNCAKQRSNENTN